MTPYTVYIVLCADTTFYTGISIDVVRRLTEHNSSKKGARYTSSRRPVQLVYTEQQPTKSAALKREYSIRTLSHSQKRKLIELNTVEK